jgi:hypothetical protein
MRLTTVRLIIILTCSLLAACLAAAAQPLEKAPRFAGMRPNIRAEKWVLKQMAAGRIADLKERFPDEANRVLSASFLEKLLANSLKGITMHRHGVRIRNAVFVEILDLENAEIPHETWLENCRFEDEVNFSQAVFQKAISFSGSSFETTTFHSMKVGAHATFSKAVFAGPVDFGHADVGRNFAADEAQFTHPERGATFYSMKVGDVAFFRETVFAGPFSLTDATVLDIIIQGPAGKASAFPSFDLSRTAIRRELKIENVKLRDLIATSIRVEGPTSLTQLSIGREANLESSTFQTISLSEVSWPPESDGVRLNAMTYQYITAGSEKDSWEKLLAMVNQAAYSTSVYASLEAFFRRQGYPQEGDAVFVAQKRRAQENVLEQYSIEWWKNLLLGILVNHGRNPEWAFGWSALFIAFGVVVFWHEKGRYGMARQKAEGTIPKYSAWWYSLDLFVPVMDLQFAHLWIPDPNRWFARNYARVHRILGWVLIPIGLAAVTGLIE